MWRDRLRDASRRAGGRLGGHAVGTALFVAVYVYLLRDIQLGALYAFGDFSPYYGAQAFEKFLSTWHYQQLGYSYLYNVLPAYLGAVTAVGGVLAQNLFYLSLLPAGFLTFQVFGARFVDRLPARYLAAGVYALNPITIGEFVNGSVGQLIGFVGFPLVLHYLYETAERDSWVSSLKTGTVFGATTVVPWLGFWMVAPFGGYLAYRVRAAPRTIVKLVAAGGVGVLLSLPTVHSILQRAGNFDTGETILVNTLRWNYADADLLSVTRLAGNRGMQAMNELGYNTDAAMTVGLVVPMVALWAWRREDLRVFYGVGAGIVTFIVLTGMGLTYPLFEIFPPLLSVRNPVKLQYPLLLCTSVVFGAGAETLLDGIPDAPADDFEARRLPFDRNATFSVFVVGIVLLSLVSYVAPASGTLGMDEVRGDDYYVPEEYDQLASTLDGKALWLPYGYTTQLRLRAAYPNHVGIKSGGVLHGIQNTQYVTDLFDDFASGEAVDQRLASLGVRYVVVDGQPPNRYASGPPRLVEKWGAPWLWGDPQSYAERLDGSDAYSLVERRGNFTVYRVDETASQERTTRRRGLHAVAYPEQSSVEPLGDNAVRNPSFDEGLDGWWTPPEEKGTRVELVEESGTSAAELTTAPSADKPLPIAQTVSVRDGYPYRLSVAAEGEGKVLLVWYDGEKAKENLVTTQTVDVGDTPTTLRAKGKTLSLRILPNGSRITVNDVTLRRTTYPAATSLAAASEGVPGVVVDARNETPASAATVAVNLDADSARRMGADTRIVDAETALDGELVFDSDYRQDVAVRVPGTELPEAVPDNATVVSKTDGNATLVDYWVVGEFDDRSVTVLHTSYDEGWSTTAGAEHFEAADWANGFVGAEPTDVRWNGGTDRRHLVVRLWLGAWGLVAGVLLTCWTRRHLRRLRGASPRRPSRTDGGSDRTDD